tara:strand:+ start:174 stop:509 length:336 start_codon:yes stop_codon:yes gene_type:complete
MSLFKNPLLIILLVLTSFVSFGQDEIVSYSYSGATDLGFGMYGNMFEYPSCKGFSISIVFADDGDYRIRRQGGPIITYSYDSTLRTMNITAEPHSSLDCDTINSYIEIYDS